MKPIPISEDALTIAVVDYCRVRKGGREKVMHIPNEGSDRAYPARAAKLIRMGLVPGASDLFFPVPFAYRKENGALQIRCGLWLELKSEGKRPTPAQMDFLTQKANDGYCCDWADNFDQAIAIIDNYFREVDGRHEFPAHSIVTADGQRFDLGAFQPSGKPS